MDDGRKEHTEGMASIYHGVAFFAERHLASTVVFAHMLLWQSVCYPKPSVPFPQPPVDEGSLASPPGPQHEDPGLPALPPHPTLCTAEALQPPGRGGAEGAGWAPEGRRVRAEGKGLVSKN